MGVIYRVTSPRLGLDHGTWSGPSPAHALAAMLTAAGYPAQPCRRRLAQIDLFGPVTDDASSWGVALADDAEARLQRAGLALRGFRVVELEPIPMALFA